MRNWFRIAIVFLLWIVHLFTGTGLDTVYHVTQYTRWAVLAVSAATLLAKTAQARKLPVERKRFLIFGGMVVLFFASSIIHSVGGQPVHYLWVFLLVYLLSQLSFTEKDFFWIGLSYGTAGFVVLLLFSQSRVFSGWNENSIAMISVFSFLVLLIPLYKERSRWSKVRIVVLTVLFAVFVNPTNSRASILFLAVGVIFALGFVKRTLIIKQGKRLTFYLMIPLLVATITIIISRSGVMTSLDAWSLLRFGKPFFNGRDELWTNGLELFLRHFFIGTGNLTVTNWHNSAISVLVAYGVLGFILWLASIHDILSRAYPFMTDYIVQGCFIGFIIIYFQQSLELGLVSSSPSLIPYVMLGLMLGRIRYLKSRNEGHDEA